MISLSQSEEGGRNEGKCQNSDSFEGNSTSGAHFIPIPCVCVCVCVCVKFKENCMAKIEIIA